MTLDQKGRRVREAAETAVRILNANPFSSTTWTSLALDLKDAGALAAEIAETMKKLEGRER